MSGFIGKDAEKYTKLLQGNKPSHHGGGMSIEMFATLATVAEFAEVDIEKVIDRWDELVQQGKAVRYKL